VKAAHEHGIRCYNRCRLQHFGPGDLALWQFDGWSENNKGGIYFYNDRRSQTPWGETRPDYGRVKCANICAITVLMWFEEYRADGLRWDMIALYQKHDGSDNNSANAIPEGWSLMQWNQYGDPTIVSGKISIGESMKNNPWVIKDVGAGGAGFNAQWDAEFVHPVRQAVITRDDKLRDLGASR